MRMQPLGRHSRHMTHRNMIKVAECSFKWTLRPGIVTTKRLFSLLVTRHASIFLMMPLSPLSSSLAVLATSPRQLVDKSLQTMLCNVYTSKANTNTQVSFQTDVIDFIIQSFGSANIQTGKRIDVCNVK